MTEAPISLFAAIADHAAVARRLRELAPTVEIEGPDHDWRSATIDVGGSGGRRTLTLKYDPRCYVEPNWSKLMNVMPEYLSRFPATGRKHRAMLLPATFRYSLGIQLDPEPAAGGDPRLDLLFALAEALDAVLFSPSALRDARGRILVSAAGEADEDPAAVWPRVAAKVRVPSQPGATSGGGPQPPEADDDEDDDEDDDDPPSAERVARRALALAAVTARAFLEADVPEQGALGKLGTLLGLSPGAGGRLRELEPRYRELLRWVDETGIDDELEEQESELLRQPLGKVDARSRNLASWRLEGLAVLAWALGRFELPPHDEPVSANPLWESLGLLRADAGRALLANPVLRPREEIEALRNRLFAIHWRLRNFSLRPNVMDFAAFARTAWFGPLDLTGLPLVEGDLAIRGMRIDRVPPEVGSLAVGAAVGRHQAANWLCEGPAEYSEADTST